MSKSPRACIDYQAPSQHTSDTRGFERVRLPSDTQTTDPTRCTWLSCRCHPVRVQATSVMRNSSVDVVGVVRGMDFESRQTARACPRAVRVITRQLSTLRAAIALASWLHERHHSAVRQARCTTQFLVCPSISLILIQKTPQQIPQT